MCRGVGRGRAYVFRGRDWEVCRVGGRRRVVCREDGAGREQIAAISEWCKEARNEQIRRGGAVLFLH